MVQNVLIKNRDHFYSVSRFIGWYFRIGVVLIMWCDLKHPPLKNKPMGFAVPRSHICCQDVATHLNCSCMEGSPFPVRCLVGYVLLTELVDSQVCRGVTVCVSKKEREWSPVNCTALTQSHLRPSSPQSTEG